MELASRFHQQSVGLSGTGLCVPPQRRRVPTPFWWPVTRLLGLPPPRGGVSGGDNGAPDRRSRTDHSRQHEAIQHQQRHLAL